MKNEYVCICGCKIIIESDLTTYTEWKCFRCGKIIKLKKGGTTA